MSDYCNWFDEDVDSGDYQTECCNLFKFTAGCVEDNGFMFCPFCGLRIWDSSDE